MATSLCQHSDGNSEVENGTADGLYGRVILMSFFTYVVELMSGKLITVNGALHQRMQCSDLEGTRVQLGAV